MCLCAPATLLDLDKTEQISGAARLSTIYADTEIGALTATELESLGIVGGWAVSPSYGRSARIYNRELTADEVKNNYQYCVGQREAN